ncbi:MAG: sulfate/thiosulfate transport system substrate-binding protein [Frankiales bacterium]|nr:sulfate/thiosulfate transport system substrate-binding protein [Frankiales bacterium]
MSRTVARHAVLLTGVTALFALTACGSSSSGAKNTAATGGSGGKVTLNLVAYSTPQAAYTAEIKAFQATPAGKNVDIKTSFGASGDQSRAVASGQAADIVAFSLAPDIDRLVKANLVAADWNANQYKGMITDSVVVITTRKGNPKNIKTWDDLVKPGVQVLTPNPFSSGSARWNILAAYGAEIKAGKTEAQATAYLTALFKNVPVQADSGRASLQVFTGGKGDAILTYENEAIFAQQNKQAIDYTVPDSTILIENPIAVTSKSSHPTQAKAFLDFLYSEAGQKIYEDNGYRPIVPTTPGADKFPKPAQLFTITDLGGWTAATKKFFDADTGLITTIEKNNGVSTTGK